MQRVQFYLPEKLVRELRFLARREDRPMSEIAREGLKKEIEERKSKAKPKMSAEEALLKMAEHAFEGPGDLSTNLFDYLYGDKSPNYGKRKGK